MDVIQKFILNIVGDNYTTEWEKLNYIKIPVTIVNASVGNEDEYNKLYQMLLKSKYKRIKRTESNGISINFNERLDNWNKYDVRQLGAVNEITVCTLEMSARIQWRINNYKKKDGTEDFISATEFYNKYWCRICKKYGINMADYYCTKEEGLEYKKQIHKPDIKIINPAAYYQQTILHAYHLDFHKFYPSGLINTHPEFKPVVEYFAEKAKEDDLYKIGIDSLIGLWQSKTFNYKLAKLSKDAINDAYSRFDKVLEALREEKRALATNTDGIWYHGPEYHGEFEGNGLTQWSTDHFDCKIRFKSKGSYEFIENGKYYPVVRGHTKLDKKLPRDQWEWGDIFYKDAEAQKWTFKEGVGIIWQKQE